MKPTPKLSPANLLGLLAIPVVISAQQFSIDWFTLDGGGGTSTGGAYSLSGTIGQLDAGDLNGGGYSLAGGFWGIVGTIQTPGAPLLAIQRTTTNTMIVSWPSPSTGFVLQQNGNLDIASWSVSSEPVADNGTNKFILVQPPTGRRFYRLSKP